MKRYSGLHDKLCTIENIEVADDNARKNKNKKYGINKHDKNRQYENEDLVDKLFNLKYKTSKYSLYKIYEPKERIIYRLPYYPDRIAHHAIMNVVKYIWTKSFIHNTYSCIEGRGIHLCANNLKRDLRKYPNETKYCLKLDIRKFYPSIPHNGLKKCIRKKIKDKDFLMILDEIIDSTDNVRDVSSKLTNKIGIGVPIGNYLSQYFANLYLSELDHLCKEELKCKFYYRYADDIVILSDDKDFLHKVLIYIKLYVHTIGLKVKDNYQIYPVDSRGINFVGYVFYHTHTLIRKSIKYKIIRLVNSYLNREIDKKEFKVRMCAYYGWLKHADAKNLLYKIQSLTGVRYSNWNGKRTNIAKYYGKYVRIIQVINYAKYFRINFIRNGKAYYADSRDKTLFYSIHRLNHFPINFKITKYDRRIYTKNRIRPNPMRIKVTRASQRTENSVTAKQKHTNSFICILSIITSYPIIISFFISSNFIRNKIRTKSKIKFSNKIITISLVTYKITFILNIIYCNIGMINTFFKKINTIIICIAIYNNYISNKCPYITKKV
jgi:RNA-directed DNA polymerase